MQYHMPIKFNKYIVTSSRKYMHLILSIYWVIYASMPFFLWWWFLSRDVIFIFVILEKLNKWRFDKHQIWRPSCASHLSFIDHILNAMRNSHHVIWHSLSWKYNTYKPILAYHIFSPFLMKLGTMSLCFATCYQRMGGKKFVM